MDEDEDVEMVRVYAWSRSWVEVGYGRLDWPSYSSRMWFFDPWPAFMR